MTAPLRVVVVDDEALSRRGIRARLARLPDVALVAEAHDASSGITAVVAHRPDLLFLDIAMPGADGFALLANLPPDVHPLTVFVTAHADQALRAFGVQALDYLLKPIDDLRFMRTVERARAQRAARGSAVAGRLLVRETGRIVAVDVEAIDWVQSEGDYVRIYAGAATYLHLSSMVACEGELPAQSFFRIHREAIVNLARVRSMVPITNGDYSVLLTTGARLRLSRTRRAAFLRRLADRSQAGAPGRDV